MLGRGVTPDDVRFRVAEIAAMADDPEAAHGFEDSLWSEVLRAIAKGADDPAGLARAALETLELDFPRWRA